MLSVAVQLRNQYRDDLRNVGKLELSEVVAIEKKLARRTLWRALD